MGRTHCSNATAPLPKLPSNQAVGALCAHPLRVAREDRESKTEFPDLERDFEEMIPAPGSHREKAFYKQKRSAFLFLRCPEEWHCAAHLITEIPHRLSPPLP